MQMINCNYFILKICFCFKGIGCLPWSVFLFCIGARLIEIVFWAQEMVWFGRGCFSNCAQGHASNLARMWQLNQHHHGPGLHESCTGSPCNYDSKLCCPFLLPLIYWSNCFALNPITVIMWRKFSDSSRFTHLTGSHSWSIRAYIVWKYCATWASVQVRSRMNYAKSKYFYVSWLNFACEFCRLGQSPLCSWIGDRRIIITMGMKAELKFGDWLNIR